MDGLLLDTHVVYWLATDPQQIPPRLLQQLEDAEWVFVSAVSAYELAQKSRLGRLPGAAGLLSRWEHFVDLLMAEELALTSEEATRAGLLEWEHRDPFDRMLVAQAQINGLCIVTKDEAIRSYAEVVTAEW